MQKSIVVATLTTLISVVGFGQAHADQSGMAGMHAQYTVKGRRCFSSHTHVGTGAPMRSKKAAVIAAAQDWSSFTAFEYGSSWASWNASIAKTVKCEPSGAKWSCEVQARPCLIGEGGSSRHARR